MAKKLLNPKDSVLIVTIDEKEYLRLGMLLEQMFPEANIDMVSSVINRQANVREFKFKRINEFIFFVMFGNCTPSKLPLTDEWTLSNSANKGVSLYWSILRRPGSNKYRKHSPGCFYPIFVKKDGSSIVSIGNSLPLDVSRDSVNDIDGCITVFPIHPDGSEGCWQQSPSNLAYLVSKGYIKIGFSNNKVTLYYLTKGERQKIEKGIFHVLGYDKFDGHVITDVIADNYSIAPSQWSITSHDASYYGSMVNLKFLPDRKFPFPKSVYAVEDCLRFFVADKSDALIVDFFAGSGTTAHATMLLNHLDGGHRRCISVTNNEIGPDNEKQFIKQGLRPMDKEWQSKGIAHYITWERIKASVTGIATNGEPVKGNYKFTEEFPMSDGFKENVVFFDLKYEDGKAIRLNMAFNDIAPLLWMRAGGKGRVIQDISPVGYDISEQYAVLFDYSATEQFLSEVRGKDIKVVYIVTDSELLYQQIYKQLPRGIEPVRLYENYLTSFAIYGAV